jgi:ATP-dependent Lon protease
MSAGLEQIKVLEEQIRTADIPDELRERVLVRLSQLGSMTESPTFLPEYDSMNRYIEWITDLPWHKTTQDTLDLNYSRQILDKNHFGLSDIKDRLTEYLAVMKLKKEKGESEDLMRAPILCFVGLVGTGKTTIAKSIAEATGRKFARIPFGGMGDPLDLRGQSRLHAEAEPGKIIKALRTAQSRNPVILLDEIDRVTDEGRASIMGVLVELLDPEQNSAFVDHYIDFPVNLSDVIFVATANNTLHISTAVLDRLEPITMPSYTDTEKITIARNYILPKVIRQSGIPEGGLIIDEDVWPNIVRPLGFDGGIRTLERTVEGVARKIARLIVEGQNTTFHINKDNVKDFLPK